MKAHRAIAGCIGRSMQGLGRRRGIVMLTCVLAIAAPVTVAWAGTTNYVASATFDDLDWGQTPGTAFRTYNMSWHPFGYYFQMFYSGDSTGYGDFDNPTRDDRNWAAAHAACQNQSGGNSLYPVTCQTDGA